MFDLVLSTPLVVNVDISVHNFLLFRNVFAFGWLKRYVFRSTFRKVSNKVGVGKNHKTFKTFLLYFHGQSKIPRSFSSSCLVRRNVKELSTSKLNIIAPINFIKNRVPSQVFLNILLKRFWESFFSRDRFSQMVSFFLISGWVVLINDWTVPVTS